MNEKFTNIPYTVNKLIEKIDSGELGLPELQRPFLWPDTKVRDMFDSMMKGYPIGHLMIWESSSLEKKKTIGTDVHSYTEPKEVIIDGQQRMTSLYAVMRNKKIIDKDYKEKNITISYNPLLNKFEVGNNAIKKDREWIYSLSDIFTTNSPIQYFTNFTEQLREYREKKGNELTKQDENIIEKNITALLNLKDYPLPVFYINRNTEEEEVSEIFVRVNSKGTPLKENDFIWTLLALYWNEGRKKIEDFSRKSNYPTSEATSYNQITTIEPSDIIRVVMAYAFDRARLKYGYKLLRGVDFEKRSIDTQLREQRFEILKNKLSDVLDVHNWHEFLKAIMNAGYLSNEIISSKNAIFYTYALYLIARYRFKATANENMHLTALWFFYVQLMSIYSGSFESTAENHLNTIKDIPSLTEYRTFVLGRIGEHLTNDYFNTTLIADGLNVSSSSGNNAWKAYVASLNILNAHILFSKSNLLVSKLFDSSTKGSRKSLEKHHLFPRKYLETHSYRDNKINQIANYAYIDWKDNEEILDQAPAVYYPIICKGKSIEDIRKMEIENALPHGWENMKYEEFLIERRKLMAKKIKEAFEILKNNAMEKI